METRKRPTGALLELEDPYTGWTSHDYRLEEAVLILDRDTCKTCGNPSWLCHTANSNVGFEIRSGWCYGKAELDDYNKGMGVEEPEAGEYRYAVAVGISTGNGDERDPLPSRREALANIATVVRHTTD